MSKILFICIDYRTTKQTQQLLADLEVCQNKELNVFVVNNGRDSESAEKFELMSSDVLPINVLTPEKNLGYFGGAQAALSVYLSKNESPPDWTIVSNSDIRIPGDFFSKLLKVDGADIVGPRIVSQRTGKNQNPYMVERPSHLKMNAYKWIFSNYTTSWPYQSLHAFKQFSQKVFLKNQAIAETDKPMPVYSVHGSFLIFHRNYFLQGGNFKHGCFLYGEEIFVAEKARSLGLKLMYRPDLKVEHQEHASIGIFPSRKKMSYIKESSRYCANEFFKL